MITLYLATGVIAGGGVTPPPPPTGLLADFRARYPAFSGVPDATVQLWLDDAAADVVAWPGDMQDRAAMLLAAHNLTQFGISSNAIAPGVTSFRSGSFSASVSDTVASMTGLSATVYGREFLALRRRAFAGPRLSWMPPAVTY